MGSDDVTYTMLDIYIGWGDELVQYSIVTVLFFSSMFQYATLTPIPSLIVGARRCSKNVVATIFTVLHNFHTVGKVDNFQIYSREKHK